MDTQPTDDAIDRTTPAKSKAALTQDERQGMTWWDALTEDHRAYGFREARTAIPAEAWAEYKRRWQFKR